jgi:hypothetical protein
MENYCWLVADKPNEQGVGPTFHRLNEFKYPSSELVYIFSKEILRTRFVLHGVCSLLSNREILECS